jgi:transcription termination/antitermination protein NusG
LVSDDPHKFADDTDEAVPDDAVSNRSDDTMLEEAPHPENGAAGNPPEMVEEEQAIAAEAEAESMSGADVDEADAAEGQDEVAEEEEPEQLSGRGAIEEDLSEEEIRMNWYILKVQSNRERSIAEALERKMKIEGLDRFFDQVIVPTEKVTEFKGGKKKVVERKLYPGYIVVHMHINDDTWFAVRETSGVGDFTGAGGKPTPMLQHEVAKIIQTEEEETEEAPKLDIKFATGDKVKVKEGNFESFEGEVNTIDEASGRVTVMINIFGRSTPVELEYWQIEAV